MKLKLIATLLIATNVSAFEIDGIDVGNITIPDELKQYKCDSPEVRLSKDPMSCLGEFPKDFDIPAIKLNMEDLRKIFEGAVSSGGRVVGPMSTPRTVSDLSPMDFTLNCQVRQLLDGKKRVSYLSTASLQMNNSRYFIPFAGLNFKHGLIVGNNINASRVIPAPRAPQVNSHDLFTEVHFNESSQQYGLKVCAQKYKLEVSADEKVCSFTPFNLNDSKVETMFMSTVTQPNFFVERTVKLTCSIQ